jgi:hypothetical protein
VLGDDICNDRTPVGNHFILFGHEVFAANFWTTCQLTVHIVGIRNTRYPDYVAGFFILLIFAGSDADGAPVAAELPSAQPEGQHHYKLNKGKTMMMADLIVFSGPHQVRHKAPSPSAQSKQVGPLCNPSWLN